MTCIRKVEHAPVGGIWVWFRYLEERKVGRVGRRERELVDRRHNTGVSYRPFKISGRFAADDPRR